MHVGGGDQLAGAVPMNDLVLTIPPRQTAAPPLPRCPVSVRVATVTDLPFIDRLQKMHGKMVFARRVRVRPLFEVTDGRVQLQGVRPHSTLQSRRLAHSD